MRTLTKYSEHLYTTRASAMRAARNALGRNYPLKDSEVPELRNRFDGDITIGTDMIGTEACEGGWGWRWMYTFDLGDVSVRVRYADGTIADVRYADVAHWQDATHPPTQETIPDCPALTSTPVAIPLRSQTPDMLTHEAFLQLQAHLSQPCPMPCDHEVALYSNACAVCNFPAVQVFDRFIKPFMLENKALRDDLERISIERQNDKLYLTEIINSLHRDGWGYGKAQDMLHAWSRELRENNRIRYPAAKLKRVFGAVVGLENW